ncbi:hypothetical protein QBC35DRAFT_453792 [Podospora australis]|uniref:Arca-like protein n=1 Tax=Podospora australis TaxID=1536484 RepID=A0AAN7AHF9_9PEZI|nr:hypothetical protein QBC35DRAFT_453792 [Podospora australis]
MKIRNNCEDAKGKTKFVFSKEQEWLEVPDKLNFYNVTGMVERDEPLDDESYVEAHAIKIEDDPVSSAGTPTAVNSPQSSTTPPVSQPPSLSLSISTENPASPAFSSYSDARSPTDRIVIPVLDPARSFALSPNELSFPLDNHCVEAHLYRHYIQHLSDWLDLCDPFQSFRVMVPQMAMGNKILRDAIFALSARHLAHLCRDKEPYRSLYSRKAKAYDEQSIENINNSIEHESGRNPACFAAAIILRVVEEMNAVERESDLAVQLTGIRGFIFKFATNNNNDITKGTLGAASYWVGLRQAIYTAVMHRRALDREFHLEIPIVINCSLPQDDYDWSNWAVAHCAHVLNFCYKPASHADKLQRWHELADQAACWRADLPPWYMPYVKQTEDKAFPEQWHFTSCQVIGVQHFLLADLFHRAFHPDLLARNEILPEDEVQPLVREICGIGLGNQGSAPAMFTACMAIFAFGHRFPARRDQEAMIDVLIQTENQHARPTTQIQEYLRNAWGGWYHQ